MIQNEIAALSKAQKNILLYAEHCMVDNGGLLEGSRFRKEGLLTPILDMQTTRLRNEKALMDLENMQNDLRRRKADLAWQLKALEVLEREQEAREKKALEKKNGQVVYG